MQKKALTQNWIIMNNNVNIAIIGLGQIGNYLYNELDLKKKYIEKKPEKK